MISFEEFLEEWVAVNATRKTPGIPMSRKDYYDRYMPNLDPLDFYMQLCECDTFVGEKNDPK